MVSKSDFLKNKDKNSKRMRKNRKYFKTRK